MSKAMSMGRARVLPPALLAPLAALALAACGQPGTAPPAATPDTVESQPQQPQQPPQQPPKPKITARQLLGQSDTWVVAQLGAPQFRREDREASMWQYKNGTCVLNLFLYAETAGTRVLHFDARDLGGGNADRDRCLSVLQD